MKKEISKENLIKILYIVASFLFAIPSIIYIIKNKTIYKFYYVWTWLFRRPQNFAENIINAFLFTMIFSIIFLLYICIIKNYKKMFNNKKQIMTLIILVSIIFTLIIPYTSTDVYSYIANGWSNSKYQENPYYKSVEQIEKEYQVNDIMFNKVARCWRNETVVYGPFWTFICKILTSLSFGNIDIALFIFKMVNLFLHILNCIVIWKITKRKNFVLLYGLNPFILFEALANVHNDIFIIFFLLIAIYFAINKKNIFIAIAFIALATAIKYLAILALPFILLYCLRDKKISLKIGYCILYGIEFLLILFLIYLLYIKDISILSGLFIQQNKYNRSIMLIINNFTNANITNIIKNSIFIAFIIYYAYVSIKMLLIKNSKLFSTFIRKYNLILFLFIFVIITNFNPWYIMWMYSTIFWLRNKDIDIIINLSYSSQIANIFSFALYSEEQILGIPYLIIMMTTTLILTIIQRKSSILKEKIVKEN